jgi:hypothetical protein
MSLWSVQARGFPSHYLPINTSARPRRALPWPIPPLKTRQISATSTRQGTERGGLSNLPLRYQRELDYDYPGGGHSFHMRDTASFHRRPPAEAS